MGMKLYKLSCPNCNGNLEIKFDKHSEIYCPYCGQKFLVNEGKQEININIRKKTEHTRRYVDEAEVIKAKDEYNKSKFAFLVVVVYVIFAVLASFGLKIDSKNDKKAAEQAIAAGKICAGYTSQYKEQDFNAVIDQLTIIGFENIETVDLNDAGLFKNKKDTVASVTINGASFSSDDYFYPTDQVVITYH